MPRILTKRFFRLSARDQAAVVEAEAVCVGDAERRRVNAQRAAEERLLVRVDVGPHQLDGVDAGLTEHVGEAREPFGDYIQRFDLVKG